MSDSSAESDAVLMRLVQAGDTARFTDLIQRYQMPLLRVARSRLGRQDWAEDAVQETFLSAFKSRHSYRDAFSFRTWLWTILLNQCRQLGSRRSRQPQVTGWSDDQLDPTSPLETSVAAPGDAAPLAKLLAKERTALLEALLDRLSPVQADALRLRFFGGLKFQEIADAMGCSLGTAKNRVQWGLLRLSELLAESKQGGKHGLEWQD